MPTEMETYLTLPVTKIDEPPVIALIEAPLEAVMPTGQTVAIAEVVEPPPVQAAAAVQTPEPEERLAETASLLPLAGLIGLLSLVAGFALSRFPRRPA